MMIAFYGSSLLSSYWNGAATYYRGLLRDLAGRGHAITFYEPDAFERQSHRDIEPPDWARVVVWPATEADARRVAAEASRADVVVKASGVGVFDDLLLAELLRAARPGALRLFWDVDAAATLAELRDSGPGHPLRHALKQLDLVLTYGGGPPVVAAYQGFGARQCHPDLQRARPHHPPPGAARRALRCRPRLPRQPPSRPRGAGGGVLPRRRRRLPARHFLLGGNGWDGKPMPGNVRRIGHVGTADHNAFNCSPRAVLNVARDSMAAVGFSPATRVFEAAGAGACLITDAWEGVEMFLQPGEEVLVARDGREVAEHLAALTPARAQAIGQAALRRVLASHTYARRGAEVDRLLRHELARKAERAEA